MACTVKTPAVTVEVRSQEVRVAVGNVRASFAALRGVFDPDVHDSPDDAPPLTREQLLARWKAFNEQLADRVGRILETGNGGFAEDHAAFCDGGVYVVDGAAEIFLSRPGGGKISVMLGKYETRCLLFAVRELARLWGEDPLDVPLHAVELQVPEV